MISFRLASPDDADAVARVHVRSWQHGYHGLMPDSYLAGLRPEDRARRYAFARRGPTDPVTIVACRDDGGICGFVTTGPCRDPVFPGAGEVFAIYLDPDDWGTGVGRGLMARGRQRLGELGFTEAVLWVLAGNERAERFYRADSWVADGDERDDEVWGRTVRERRYRRSLP